MSSFGFGQKPSIQTWNRPAGKMELPKHPANRKQMLKLSGYKQKSSPAAKAAATQRAAKRWAKVMDSFATPLIPDPAVLKKYNDAILAEVETPSARAQRLSKGDPEKAAALLQHMLVDIWK